MMAVDRWIAPLAPLCHDLLQFGISLLLQSTFLLALGGMAACLVARREPALASLVQRATLTALIASGILTFIAPGWLRPFWSVSLPSATAAAPAPTGPSTIQPAEAAPSLPPREHSAAIATAPGLAAPAASPESHPAALPAAPGAPAAGSGPFDDYLRRARISAHGPRTSRAGLLYVGIVALWAAIAAASLLWLGLCQLQLARLYRRSAPLRDGETLRLVRDLAALCRVHAPRVRVTRSDPVLFLAGCWRPVLFLPSSYARDFDEPALVAVLIHELAHRARHDCAWNLVARLACAVGWVQPLLWRLRSEMEETAEACCDQAVVAGHCPPSVYACCLLDVAERFSLTAPSRAAGTGIVTLRSALARRVQRLLERSFAEPRPVSARSRIAVGVAALALVAVSLRALAAPPSVAIRARDERQAALDLFRDDDRLSKTITVTALDRPLGALLSELGRDLAVPLTASPETADDKTTLLLNQRPAAEALALVAVHFGFRWERRKEGYLLIQTPAAQQREAALRERDLREQLSAIEAKLQGAVRQQSAPKAALWQQLRAVMAEIRAVSRLMQAPSGQENQGEAGRSSSQARLEQRLERLHQQRHAIWDQIDPRRDASLAIYRSLTPLQVQRLVEGRELVLATTDGTMAPATARAVRQSYAREAEGLKEQDLHFLLLFAPQVAKPATEIAVRVRLVDLRVSDDHRDVVGPPNREHNRIRLEFLFGAARSGPVAMDGSGQFWVAEAEPSRPKRASTKTADTVLLRPVTLRFPKTGPGQATIDAETLARAYETFGVWPGGMRTVGEIAVALHRATGLEIVADSFVRARLAPDRFQEPRSPAAILDLLAEELDYTWRKEGNTIFLRNARFYRDRSEEAPERVLAPWRQTVRRQGNATLDDLAALAVSLTEPQVRGVHQFWGWHFEGLPTLPPVRGSGGFYGSYPHLRLWAALSPLQRRRALAGDPVLGSQLSLPQRRLLDEAALSIGTDDRPDIRQGDPTTALSPAQAQSGALFIQAGSLLPQNEDPFKVISYYLSYHGPGEPHPSRSFEIQLIAPQGYGRP
jgi:beta-lactamase regulating signal transducer with metallopeptidase domain